MPSPASILLASGVASLLAVHGDALTFRSLSLTALVDRPTDWDGAGPLPATWILLKQSAVASIPLPGERMTDNVTGVRYTVLFSKKVDDDYKLQCYVLDDVPVEDITIGGTQYSGHCFSATEGTDLRLGGFTNENFMRVALDRADVSTMPTEGMAVTFRNASTYRVMRVQRDAPGAPVIVDIAHEAGKGNS